MPQDRRCTSRRRWLSRLLPSKQFFLISILCRRMLTIVFTIATHSGLRAGQASGHVTLWGLLRAQCIFAAPRYAEELWELMQDEKTHIYMRLRRMTICFGKSLGEGELPCGKTKVIQHLRCETIDHTTCQLAAAAIGVNDAPNCQIPVCLLNPNPLPASTPCSKVRPEGHGVWHGRVLHPHCGEVWQGVLALAGFNSRSGPVCIIPSTGTARKAGVPCVARNVGVTRYRIL